MKKKNNKKNDDDDNDAKLDLFSIQPGQLGNYSYQWAFCEQTTSNKPLVTLQSARKYSNMTILGFAHNIPIFTFIFTISITHVLLPNKSVTTVCNWGLHYNPLLAQLPSNSSHLTAMVLLTANEILLHNLISSTALMNHSASNWSEGHTMATTLCMCMAVLFRSDKSITTKIVAQVPSSTNAQWVTMLLSVWYACFYDNY